MAMYKVSGSTNGGVYKTTDGGTTWARQTSATFSNAASFPDFIYFWDANNGIVVGDPINNEFEVYTTTNGGTTWTLLPSSQIPIPLSGETAYTSDFCVVGNNIWFGTAKGRVYASTDQGNHWIVALPPGFSGKNSFPAYQDNLNGLAMKFYTAADTLSLIKSSIDGGTSYSALTYAGSVLTGDIKYVPGTPSTYVTTGWDGTNQGTGRMGVTYSFDGGTTWITEPSINGTGLTCSSWLNDSTGWIGAFNSGPTDGIYKYNSILVPPLMPVAAFMTPDTLVALGGSSTFVNESTGSPTSYLWTFQDATPATSTLQNPTVLTWNAPGRKNVSLQVTNVNGSNTLTKTGYVKVGEVGFKELNQNSVSVFPNPANDFVTVQAMNTIKNIQVYNLAGQLVFEQTSNAKFVTVKTSSLSAGVYNLKATLENGTINKKIVIQ